MCIILGFGQLYESCLGNYETYMKTKKEYVSPNGLSSLKQNLIGEGNARSTRTKIHFTGDQQTHDNAYLLDMEEKEKQRKAKAFNY
jgi:hypothetical protein